MDPQTGGVFKHDERSETQMCLSEEERLKMSLSPPKQWTGDQVMAEAVRNINLPTEKKKKRKKKFKVL